MSNQDMITAITNSIQTDANLLILIRFLITGSLNDMVPPDGTQSPDLVNSCRVLGIPT